MTGGASPGAPLGAALGPLAVWAVAGVIGAWTGDVLSAAATPSSTATWSTIGARCVAASLFGLAGYAVIGMRRGGAASGRSAGAWRGPGVVAGVVAALLVVATTAVGVGLRDASTAHGLLPELAAYGGRAELLVTVATEPRRVSSRWESTDDAWLAIVRVDSVDGRATRERAALRLRGRPPTLGSRWRTTATARPVPADGFGRWLTQQHAVVLIEPHRLEPVASAATITSASEHVRDRVRAAAVRHLDVSTAGVLVGFVTGDTRLLPTADEDAMRASGLSHLTAVSGSNLAIVVGGVVAVLAAFRVGIRGRWVAVAAVIPWFAFVTRFEPSVLRAGVMAGILLAVAARGQVRDARHALVGAVLLLVLVDPRLAGSLGLLLSATATAGVLIVAPAVRRRLPDRLPARAADLAAITLGAQIAVLPLLLSAFGSVGTATVPANLLAVPVAAVAATLGFVGAVVALVHPGAGALVFALAGVPGRVVLTIAHTFASWGGTIDAARPATLVAALAACGWLAARASRVTTAVTAILAATAVVLALAPTVAGRLPPDGFSVTAIDVGQGDAFLVETPGSRILVDAGSDETVARWLAGSGRTWLDLVVVTHPHTDHIGGLAEVLRTTRVTAVWATHVPVEVPEAADALGDAVESGVRVRVPIAGSVATVGDTVIEVLHPPPGRPYRFAQSELNETSLVLRIHHAGRRALFTGDIELAAQAHLLAVAGEKLSAELLTVPHHGAGTSDPAFLAAVGARVALIGVGVDNTHGHPHPATLEALETAGVVVRRTDRDGTVRVEVPARLAPARFTPAAPG